MAWDASASSASGSSASRPVRTASISSSAPRDVAEQDRADGAAVGVDDQLAVAAGPSSATTTARAPSAEPAAHEVDAHDLELRRRDRALVGGFAAGQRRAAATFACSWIGATMPWTTPRCCAHSPTASTRGCEVTMRVVDDDPALDVEARRRARGRPAARMPTEMTTRSAGELVPSAKRSRDARRAGDLLACWRSSRTSTPSASIAGREQRGGAGVELALHQAVHEVHDRRLAAERGERRSAASSPSRPPPMTTARRAARRLAIAAQSSGPRKTWACCAPGDRRDERVAARADHVAVVAGELLDARVEQDLDVVVLEPAGGAQRERVGVRAAGQQRGERDAVVGEAGLGARERELDVAGRARGSPRAPPARRSRRRRRGRSCPGSGERGGARPDRGDQRDRSRRRRSRRGPARRSRTRP